MNYKVGDRVRIRVNAYEIGRPPGQPMFTNEMKRFQGAYATVKSIRCDQDYQLIADEPSLNERIPGSPRMECYHFLDYMLEPATLKIVQVPVPVPDPKMDMPSFQLGDKVIHDRQRGDTPGTVIGFVHSESVVVQWSCDVGCNSNTWNGYERVRKCSPHRLTLVQPAPAPTQKMDLLTIYRKALVQTLANIITEYSD